VQTAPGRAPLGVEWQVIVASLRGRPPEEVARRFALTPSQIRATMRWYRQSTGGTE
jgi:hypothetical protein